jgi:glycosyltransferase involved in cell wall biosynthesis
VLAPLEGIDYRSSLPRPMSAIPHRLIANAASRLTERRYLAALGDDAIAYLWPNASLSVYEAAHDLGLPIVGEGINTRMEFARDVLDAVYVAEGLPPGHGITDERVKEENQKLEMTAAFFAPSIGVEQSLSKSPLAPENVLQTSYGVMLSGSVPKRRTLFDGGLAVLFVGSGSFRKGLHKLLQAWSMAGIHGRLILAGRIEPALKDIYSEYLNRTDVEVLGFVQNVQTLYETADVFVLPSFEEGDPLVTYEAAAHGIPIVASAMGAGRIGEKTGCVIDIDPAEPETIVQALRQLANSRDDLSYWGSRCLAAVTDYSWTKVGQLRAEMLAEHLGL